MPDATSDLATRAARLLDGELGQVARCGGGDLALVVDVSLADGRRAVAKGGPAPLVEAAMLEAIRATGAPAPAVLAADAQTLVLEALPRDGTLETAWADLGAVVARLHEGSGTHYGWHCNYAFGPVAIANEWADDWPQFWGERRLRHRIDALPAGIGRRIDRLTTDLGNRLPARPRPVLLHGDLWTGNVLVSRGSVSGLIDPACYYGDREVDLAMLQLFGRPPPEFYAAYEALEPGYQSRVGLYQLWPALVHLRLFGAGYRGLVEDRLQCLGV